MDSWVFKELGITPDVNLLDDLYEYELACPEGVRHTEEEDSDEQETTNPEEGCDA